MFKAFSHFALYCGAILWIVLLLFVASFFVISLLLIFDDLCRECIDGNQRNQHVKNNHVEGGSQKQGNKNSGGELDNKIAEPNKMDVSRKPAQTDKELNECEASYSQNAGTCEDVKPVDPKQDVQGAVVLYAGRVKIDCYGEKDNQTEE